MFARRPLRRKSLSRQSAILREGYSRIYIILRSLYKSHAFNLVRKSVRSASCRELSFDGGRLSHEERGDDQHGNGQDYRRHEHESAGEWVSEWLGNLSARRFLSSRKKLSPSCASSRPTESSVRWLHVLRFEIFEVENWIINKSVARDYPIY